MTERPADWPDAGPIDLDVHDPPHRSAVTEWWYVNAHLKTADERTLSVFASFFRVVTGRDEATKQPIHGHSLTWALTDADGERYLSDTLVDAAAPRLGLEKMERGEGVKDERLRRALREILERERVPYPDRVFASPPHCAARRLKLDFGGNTLTRDDEGRYRLHLFHPYHRCGVDLVLAPTCGPVRHGDDGVVRGHDGADMFYYFVPRCDVTGRVIVDGLPTTVIEGAGWYDHEFGGHGDPEVEPNEHVAWTWMGLQLDDGRAVSLYRMVDVERDEELGQMALLIGADGQITRAESVQIAAEGAWRSTRTFNTYPTAWDVSVPALELSLRVEAAFADQEFVTLISKPAFWEGRATVRGRVGGAEVTGRGYVERSGFVDNQSLDDFFRSVGAEVRASVARLLPFEPGYEQVRDLIASEEREHYMEGVDLAQFVRTGVAPVRAITDRGGKGWRSYAALACCDVVGGDSRDYVHWLAMPELMHVGSLIVDDVQDRSSWRRGGPTCHELHGDALAINAGTSAYFMGQHLLQGTDVSDADKVRLYNLYFEALRAGHAGQAADIEGLDSYVPAVVDSGDARELESKVLAIHRLKTAAPAGALARMGAIVGGGSEAQIEGLGRFFESIGVAFQMIDDVLNLRGFERGLKARGEDVAHGKVTLPIAIAFGRLERDRRAWLWETLRTKPEDQAVIDGVIEVLEGCGAVEACALDARELVERAWSEVHPLLEDSIVKMMLRSFGWYVLERHY